MAKVYLFGGKLIEIIEISSPVDPQGTGINPAVKVLMHAPLSAVNSTRGHAQTEALKVKVDLP